MDSRDGYPTLLKSPFLSSMFWSVPSLNVSTNSTAGPGPILQTVEIIPGVGRTIPPAARAVILGSINLSSLTGKLNGQANFVASPKDVGHFPPAP